MEILWILGAIIAIVFIAKFVSKKRDTVSEETETMSQSEGVQVSLGETISSYEKEAQEEPVKEVSKLSDIANPDSEKPFAKLKMAEASDQPKEEPVAPKKTRKTKATTASSDTGSLQKPKRVYKKRTPKIDPPVDKT